MTVTGADLVCVAHVNEAVRPNVTTSPEVFDSSSCVARALPLDVRVLPRVCALQPPNLQPAVGGGSGVEREGNYAARWIATRRNVHPRKFSSRRLRWQPRQRRRFSPHLQPWQISPHPQSVHGRHVSHVRNAAPLTFVLFEMHDTSAVLFQVSLESGFT